MYSECLIKNKIKTIRGLMMKEIILTIDTEGPRGSDPVLYQIWGKVADNTYLGISKIIEICDKYQVKGLFFVDIPEIWDMGYEKIKEVILYILDKGHDVGVHVHPHHMPGEDRQFLFDYSKEEQRKIIEQCTEKYVEITGEYPKSFRAGKYGANRDTLDIISELGYRYDFSEFYSQKWCGINPEIAYVLPQKYKKLIEFPVTIFRSFKLGNLYQRYDKLEATNNVSEMKHVLDLYASLKKEGVITLFLHSFSFINYLDTPDEPTMNKKNLENFEKIMKYIDDSKQLTFISEEDLKGMKISEQDDIVNIVQTKVFLRQLYYLYLRAYEIRKTNKKAKALIWMTRILLIVILAIVVYFIII